MAAVGERVVSLDAQSSSIDEELEELARLDPPLSFRLVHLSSEAVPKTIGGALANLGAGKLAREVVNLRGSAQFDPKTAGERNLWIHALQVAGLAKTTAELYPDANVDPDEAYLLGLLHDIGHFVMLHQSPWEFGQVSEREWTSGRDVIKSEVEVCGIDHAELGWRASMQWAVPESIASLIGEHHTFKTNIAPEYEVLMTILRLADVTSFVMLNEPSWTSRPLPEILVGIRQNMDLVGGVPFPLDVERFAGQVRYVEQAAARALDSMVPKRNSPEMPS
ncbi:MAG: HDOD domain-containing protein [Bryobacterales bacterium]